MPTSLDNIDYLVGNKAILENMSKLATRPIFDDEIMEMLNKLSAKLMHSKLAKNYPDIISFAFWIRKASLNNLKKRWNNKDNFYRLGRGVCFHIAPSNVAMNFAYSLVAGLLSGNANVVRLSSKDFKQVDIVVDAINELLEDYEKIRQYIVLIRYERNKDINDYLSLMADTRIIWGGDDTINELRTSKIKPRSNEITFANRYSLLAIDSDYYLEKSDKKSVAINFYNDTYLSDQNACTSPRIVIWLGSRIDEAKSIFWEENLKIISEKYTIQAVSAINKLTTASIIATKDYNAKLINTVVDNNSLYRVEVDRVDSKLMDYMESCGFFYEYNCSDILELRDIADNNSCQTLSVIGNKDMFRELITSGIKGIDRIVEIGHTMDFDLVWDGYDLISHLSRIVSI